MNDEKMIFDLIVFMKLSFKGENINYDYDCSGAFIRGFIYVYQVKTENE